MIKNLKTDYNNNSFRRKYSFCHKALYVFLMLLIPAMAMAEEPAPASQGVISPQKGNFREIAPPELGYGVKTEAEIMKEKPRKPRIAVLGPMEGDLEFYGLEASNGAELASDEINAKGGIKRTEFELLVYDTKGTILGMRKGVDTLIQYDTLAAVGAATGEVSFAASKMLNEGQLILLSAGSRRRLGTTGPYNFRNTLDDNEAARKLVEYLKKEKGWKKFVIFSSVVNDYSIQLTAIFKAEVINQGLEVTDELFLWSDAMTNIAQEDTSMMAQVAKLKDSKPDAIIFTGDGKEAVELMKDMREQGVTLPLVGAEDLMTADLAALGDKAAGAVFYGGFDVNTKNPKARAFVEAYEGRFGKKPSRLAALSYDAYYMLAEAAEKAKSFRPSHVKEALLKVENFNGVTGKASVTESGESNKEPFLFELRKNGDKYSYECVQNPY